MNVPGSIRDQGVLLSRGGLTTTPRSIDWHKHHLCRWLVAALCFASSCAHAQSNITLAWDRNAETNIAGYRLYYGTVTRVYTNVVNAGNATTASVTNLAAGVTYRFAVTAFNTLGAESDYSSEVAFTTTNIVTPNIPPTLAALANLTINEDAGAQTVLLTGISSGGENQTLTVTAAATPPSLIPSIGTVYVSPRTTGTVSFATAPNSWGTGVVNVTISDGFAQTARSFTVTVNPVNDAPTIATLPAATVPLNIPTVLQPVVIADIDTAASSLVVTGTSSDTNVLPNANIVIGTLGLSRTLSVHPLSTGSATVTLRVSDGLAQSAQSFLLTVTNVVTPNIPPTLAALANLTINEDAGAQTVLLTGISSGGENQTLTVTAAATPPSLISSIETVYVSPRTTGTVSFVTTPDSWGTGVVNVTVSDGLAQTVRSFTVTVTPANDAPTLTSIANSTTVEDTATPPISFTIGDAETAATSLTLSGTSSNLTLVPNANIVFGGSGSNRTVRVTPAANQFGAASISVSVSDGNLSATRTFQLTVASSNDPPTVASIANSTTVEDTATPPISFTIGDAETAAASLTVSGTSSDPTLVPSGNIVFGGSGANRTVRVTPGANQFGTASISVSVSDGAMSSTRTFQLTVASSNDPPTMAALLPATAVPNTLTALQPVVIGDIDTAAASLVVTGTSSDTNVLPNANIVLGTLGLSRTLSVRPLQSGAATVTLRVSDGVAQSAQSFLLTVTNSAGQFALSPSFNLANGGFSISWNSRVGYIYRVLTKTSLTQTTWIPLINIRATNTTTSWTDMTAGQQGLGVYKIEMTAPIGFQD